MEPITISQEEFKRSMKRIKPDPMHPPMRLVYWVTFKEKRFRLNSNTLIGDMYRLQLAFNKFKRSVYKLIPNYFK